MPQRTTTPAELLLTFDEKVGAVLAEAELEAGDLPLETALRRFEDGVRLARQGGQLLDAVEQRVEMLLEGREGTAPFPGVNDEDEDEDEDDDDV